MTMLHMCVCVHVLFIYTYKGKRNDSLINKHTCPLFTITLIRPSTASANPIIFKSWDTDDVSGKSKLSEV